MISNSVIIQSSQLSRVGINQQILNEGSSVLVRVIADKGNGRYEGSVAGIRVNLNSGKPLVVGSSFVASISTKDGVVYITPKNTEIAIGKEIEINIAQNSQIAGFLESLGISSDSLYINLFQQMKQLEMKLDTQLMYRLHNLSLRFKGKEKRASELLTALVKKNMSLNEKDLLQLLDYLSFYENESDENPANNTEGQNLLNTFNKTEKGWFIVPFELVNLKDENILGKGCIKLLFDSVNNLKLLNLCCEYSKNKYLFSLSFENKKCTKVRFNIFNLELEKVDKEIEKLKERFLKSGIAPKIEWAEIFEIEGSACESEEIYAVGGEV